MFYSNKIQPHITRMRNSIYLQWFVTLYRRFLKKPPTKKEPTIYDIIDSILICDYGFMTVRGHNSVLHIFEPDIHKATQFLLRCTLLIKCKILINVVGFPTDTFETSIRYFFLVADNLDSEQDQIAAFLGAAREFLLAYDNIGITDIDGQNRSLLKQFRDNLVSSLKEFKVLTEVFCS